jgi:hypothetical protein
MTYFLEAMKKVWNPFNKVFTILSHHNLIHTYQRAFDYAHTDKLGSSPPLTIINPKILKRTSDTYIIRELMK